MATSDQDGYSTCDIREAGLARGGYSRWWCVTHEANATGRYGRKLEECEAAHTFENYNDAFEIDPKDYPGGIALWGAVDPVYDSSSAEPETGVHVHARRVAGAEQKEIDESFEAISLVVRRYLFETKKVIITHRAAVSYYISRYLDNPIKSLFCIHCGEPHLDIEYYAVKPHRKHLCHKWGIIYLTHANHALS